MIRCKLADLEKLAVLRGKTIEDVRPCIVRSEGVYVFVDTLNPAYPRLSSSLKPKASTSKGCGCGRKKL